MITLLTLSALAAALVAGVFLTFSDFVMRGLAGSAPEAGAEAMQQINRVVYRSVFMVLLIGLVPVSLALAVTGIWLGGPAGAWMIAGAVSYALGVMAVTGRGNVPMNQVLDRMPLAQAAEGYWQGYARRWTRLNHLRTLASALTAACWLVAAQGLAHAS
ncbi:DUF1772 domain-containing protein [Mesobacterium pallidum]|uniref:anthrone oxygenase family protein n=1 Tax=Mesobacterium pallidum TaxID=2872037 RepID=UPI001EE1E0AE|nr:anthrone oxygenase family protein [Mesobacterium pallidum]